MHLRNVDLPEPDGPTMHITWPGSMVSVTPLSTFNAPKSLHTRSATTIAVIGVPPTARCARASTSSCFDVSFRDAPREKYRSR